MTVRAPMSVVLRTPKMEIDVTKEAVGLRYRLTAPGGFHSASVKLPRRLILDAFETEHFGTFFVYDSRNGKTLFEGRVEDLGREVSADGEWRELVVVGTAGHASDQERPYILLDTTLENWETSVISPYINLEKSTDPDTDNECLMFSIPQGANTAVADRVSFKYRGLNACEQELGGITYTHDSGATNTNQEIQFRFPSATLILADTRSTTPTTRSLEVTTDFARDAAAWPYLRFHVATASTPTTNPAIWTAVYSIVVKALRKNANGTDITDGASYVSDTLLAQNVVRDVVGRFCPDYTDTTIETSATHDIDQMAYIDGMTPASVFNDLMALEPSFAWYAWENGKFEWKAWPSAASPYYRADTSDGISAPSSVAEVYNKAHVRWRTGDGFTRYNDATLAVPVLDNNNLTRRKVIDLADEVGSSANAARVGDQFLAEHSTPPNAARLTVARKIVSERGEVLPQEIRPGKLISVSGIHPSVDALNATDRNAVSVFKIVAVDVDENGVATLELDSNPRTTTNALIAMAERKRKR
jgi:hypothetical protein